MDKLYLIKIGGGIVDDAILLGRFLEKFSALKGNKILVHGGGKTASSHCREMNIPIKMVKGRRITDENTLKVLKKVYSILNYKIVSRLIKKDCAAVGFSGINQNILISEKRRHPNINFGYVGDLKAGSIAVKPIQMLLSLDIVPVFSPLTHDAKGNLLNTNADTIASVLASSLSGFYDVKLIYCFEKNGVLKNIDDENSWMSQLTSKDYINLMKQERISEGMIPKLDNAFKALHAGVREVSIQHALNILENKGTLLKAGK